jgi:hypothetical protein
MTDIRSAAPCGVIPKAHLPALANTLWVLPCVGSG